MDTWFALRWPAAAGAVDAAFTAILGTLIKKTSHLVPVAWSVLIAAAVLAAGTTLVKLYQEHHPDSPASLSVRPRLYWSGPLQIDETGKLMIPGRPGYGAADIFFRVNDANQYGPVCYPDTRVAVTTGPVLQSRFVTRRVIT
jgi:hypothetical protein